MRALSLKLVGWLSAIALALGTPVYAEQDGPMTATPEVALPQLAPPPPPPPQPDRKDGAGAAAAMAAVGAAIAGASCLELLRQAAQEMDPAKKAELRNKAMMQCAQAAQNAANAAQNNDSKEQLAFHDDPKVDLPFKPEVRDFRDSESKNQASSGTGSSSPPPSEIADAGSDTDPDPAVFEFPNDGGGNFGFEPGSGFKGESISTLKPIDRAQIKYDENAKGDGTTPNPQSQPTQTSGFAIGGFSNEALRQLAGQTADATDSLKKGRKGHPEDLGIASISDGGSSSGDKGSSSDSGGLLSQLLGGKGEGAEGALQGAQLADLNVNGAGKGEKMPNIFEYAAYRIRRSKREGDIRKGTLAFNTRTTARVTR